MWGYVFPLWCTRSSPQWGGKGVYLPYIAPGLPAINIYENLLQSGAGPNFVGNKWCVCEIYEMHWIMKLWYPRELKHGNRHGRYSFSAEICYCLAHDANNSLLRGKAWKWTLLFIILIHKLQLFILWVLWKIIHWPPAYQLLNGFVSICLTVIVSRK